MITINSPLSWNNVSLREYITLQEVVLENAGDQENSIYQQIHVLYNRDPFKMPIPEFHKAVESMKFICKPIPKMKIKDRYVLNGNTYFLHKKLSDFKVGQYIDYERIIREKQGLDAYAEFIALFLTPSEDGDYGDGYDVDTVVKDILDYMSIADANSIAQFFFRLSKAYVVHFLLYSLTKTTKGMKNRKKKRELRKKMAKLIRMTLTGASSQT